MTAMKVSEQVKPWTECGVGDVTSAAELRFGMGKFYKLGERQFCDMPTATFEFADDVARDLSFGQMAARNFQSAAVWRRIE